MHESSQDRLKRLDELSALPHGDPLREHLDRNLALDDQALEHTWNQLQAEKDWMRNILQNIQDSSTLESRLLRISSSSGAIW